MAKLLIITALPTDNVTRQQLIDSMESMEAVDGEFTDGTTITVAGGKIAVGVIPQASVTGLVAALGAKQDLDATLTAIAALGDGLIRLSGGGDAATNIVTQAFMDTFLAAANVAAAQQALDLEVGVDVHPFLAQGTAVADVDDSALPADGTIGGLTVSSPPTQGEVIALRDECENLRDALAAAIATINDLKSRFEATGGNGLIADPP